MTPSIFQHFLRIIEFSGREEILNLCIILRVFITNSVIPFPPDNPSVPLASPIAFEMCSERQTIKLEKDMRSTLTAASFSVSRSLPFLAEVTMVWFSGCIVVTVPTELDHWRDVEAKEITCSRSTRKSWAWKLCMSAVALQMPLRMRWVSAFCPYFRSGAGQDRGTRKMKHWSYLQTVQLSKAAFSMKNILRSGKI